MLISRVTEATLPKFITTLMSKLEERYGKRSPVELNSWLRGCLGSNEHYFVNTTNAILLVSKIKELMHIRPDIVEIFAIQLEPGHEDELEMLYLDAYRWGKTFESKDFLLGNCTDLSAEQLAKVFNTRLLMQKIPYVKIK